MYTFIFNSCVVAKETKTAVQGISRGEKASSYTSSEGYRRLLFRTKMGFSQLG